MIYDFIIIGGGPYGINYLYNLSKNHNKNIILFEKNKIFNIFYEKYYKNMFLHNYSENDNYKYSFSIDKDFKFTKFYDFYNDGNGMIYGEELLEEYKLFVKKHSLEKYIFYKNLVKIEYKDNVINCIFEDNSIFKCKIIILAYGLDYNNMKSPGFKIINSDIIRDVDKINFNVKNKKIAYIGGNGITSMETSDYYDKSNKIYLFYRTENKKLFRTNIFKKYWKYDFKNCVFIKYDKINKIENNTIFFSDREPIKFDKINMFIGFTYDKKHKFKFFNKEEMDMKNIFYVGDLNLSEETQINYRGIKYLNKTKWNDWNDNILKKTNKMLKRLDKINEFYIN